MNGIFYNKVILRVKKRQGGGSFTAGTAELTSEDGLFTTPDPDPTTGRADYTEVMTPQVNTVATNNTSAIAPDTGGVPNISMSYEDAGSIMGDARATNSKLMTAWRKMKGGEEGFDKFVRLLGSVSFAETKRKNIKTTAEGGTANGYFQFIDDAFIVNQQRAKNAIKEYDLDPKLFDNILKAKNVEDLGVEDQALMALLHMNYSKKIPLNGFLAGQNSEEDMYRGWVGDVNGKVYKNDEHMKNFKQKKVDAANEGVNTDESIMGFLWGDPVYQKRDVKSSAYMPMVRDNTKIKNNGGILYKY